MFSEGEHTSGTSLTIHVYMQMNTHIYICVFTTQVTYDTFQQRKREKNKEGRVKENKTPKEWYGFF